MGSSRCELTELLVSECAHCRKILSPEEEAAKADHDYDEWLDNLK